ncbi:hypothetical protein H8B13_18480 [Hymenobacter sp. BT188]|uniref:hypothetical protein n=1 Tax=Hymenobacter sp. BT188 TaxID=2763504 RepID=UPI001651177F|nr:hypothetical protein [Hymenobacter sp. BT188]MBC6608818.1 hypothetical protein [Hymenobacter sp. BT188]
MNRNFTLITFFVVGLLLGWAHPLAAQRTQIRGFVDTYASYQQGKVSFGLGEQDLFITSEITPRLSFLGETVFKFSLASPTDFAISIERIILKYNYAGNHSLLIGKHHTPVNYWNDTYHHGRVFFPTIERPLLFAQGIVPLHTTGVSLQGQNLGLFRFGYDVMVGNGLGSGELFDNNRFKSLTVAVHVKPRDGWRIGASLYHDVISPGSLLHNHSGGVSTRALEKINQNILTASFAYTDSLFTKKYELLAESSMALNKSDSLGQQNTIASYAYAGLRLTDKIIPYIRVDDIHYRQAEVYFTDRNVRSFVGGVRYELNYLAVVKVEYQRTKSYRAAAVDKVSVQLAVGF